MLDVLSPMLAVGAATPIPERVTVLLVDDCGSALPLSDGMVKVVEKGPMDCGAKRTKMEHWPLAAMVCPLQLSVDMVNCAVEVIDRVPMWSDAAPAFVTVTDRSLVSPAVVLPKLSVVVERLIIGVFLTVKVKV